MIEECSEGAGDKVAMQSLLEDCKTSCEKNKGVTSVWLLSEKSMAVTMVAVSIRVVKRYAKKCCNKDCE